MARPPKSKAIERLKKSLDEIAELKSLPRYAPEFKKWHRNTEVVIANTFGKEGRHVEEFTNISYTPYVPGIGIIRGGKIVPSRSDSDYHKSYLNGLESAAIVLESMIEEIEEYWEDEDQAQISSSPTSDERIDTTKVFVVHGRDEGTKHAVARFLEQSGLKPVILSEQPDEGLTVIEKFEKHAKKVGFAVVLLTPDDVGALKCEESNLKPRARQNVILELGYFISCLGRDKVCALIKGDVETPSDYHGVIYIPMDDHGGWQKQLVRNMKAVGFDVDANFAL